jgi:long-chain acyl-CoA synthetase
MKDHSMETRLSAANIAELYRRAAETYGDLPAFATRRKALEWAPVSFADLYERGLDLATGLIELGVEAREHVGLFADNRFEWILADYGILLSGAADVPRGRDVTDAELTYIVNHAETRVAFVENEAMQQQILRLKPDMPTLREIILMDPKGTTQLGVRAMADVMALGATLRVDGDNRVQARIDGIQPDDLFTLIYTSGTTGRPKGVMLTHANMISQVEAIPVEVSCNDRVLSILPVWHSFERVFEVLSIAGGACTYYSSIRYLAEDLKNVEPTFMGSAPRLWESLYQRILKGVRESHWMRQILFHIAYFLGHYYQESVFYMTGNDLRLQHVPAWKRAFIFAGHLVRWVVLLPWYGFFNAAVLERIRQSVGGSLKATVSGGGALPLDIDRFFNYVGIPVLEGYGLTETAPVLAVRTEEHLVTGTVGRLIPRTDIRIVDLETREVLFPNPARPHEGRGLRGEIQIRGPQVMKGYFKEPELTAATFQDGWFKTGDIGLMTFNDALKILGRSKSTIVLRSGENLEPEPIEMRLGQSRFIDHCMVVGQDQKYIAALIVPSVEGFKEAGIEAQTLKELTGQPGVRDLLRAEIKKLIAPGSGFKAHELVREFELLPENFEVGRELTNLFKLKRHVVEQRYQKTIADIYTAEEISAR